MKCLPGREEIANMLRRLSAGEISPEEASAWAIEFVLDGNFEAKDEIAWETMIAIGGTDIQVADNTYLYGPSDFESWLKMLG